MEQWVSLFRNTLTDRDLVVFDQRGVGYSQPSLNCPEAEDPFYKNLEENLTTVEEDNLFTHAIQACRDRLIENGVNLAAYTSAANAHDVEDLRKALGISQWNLFGISYGTRLALTVMRDFPDGVRSVILDSVYPPQVDLYAEVAVNGERALNLVFNRCMADPACNQAYPELKQVFYDLVDQLDAHPVSISLFRPIKGDRYEFLMNGDRLINTTFDLLYNTESISRLPGLIYGFRDSDWDKLRQAGGFLPFMNDFWSEGMYHSIQCGEEASFGSLQDIMTANAVVTPRFRDAFNNGSIFQTCAVWEYTSALLVENEPVVSDIPVLILAGDNDPITPPAWSKSAAENLTSAQYLEFPGFGHGVVGSGTDNGLCSKKIVGAFLANPKASLDSSCISEFKPYFETK
jgi:pimeloyl-ACP methyl ester carboxylesterase